MCIRDSNITERPKKLSEDDSRIVPGIRSALIEQGENGYVPDYIILNQPTSPFRLIKDLENSIENFITVIISKTSFRLSDYNIAIESMMPLFKNK